MASRIPAVLAAILLLATMPPAGAEDGADYPFYAGFSFGFAGTGLGCDYYGYSCDGDGTGFSFFGGKRLHENFGVEIAYHDLGKFRNERRGITTTAETQGINLSLLGIIPTGDLGFFYGKIGYMTWNAEYTASNQAGSIDDDGTDLTYGIGYAFTFGEKYAARIEFEELLELGDEFADGGASVSVIYFGGSINFN